MNQPGKSLGVIGLGGLGHLAVKFGKAFGLRVTVFSTSITKKDEALNLLGADHFVISSDEKEMRVKSYHPSFERGPRSLVPWLMKLFTILVQAMEKSLDFIINTASGGTSFDLYLSLLKTMGVLVLVGFPSEVKFHPGSLILGTT